METGECVGDVYTRLNVIWMILKAQMKTEDKTADDGMLLTSKGYWLRSVVSMVTSFKPFYCFVCLSVSVCPFAALVANKDLYTTASAPIQQLVYDDMI